MGVVKPRRTGEQHLRVPAPEAARRQLVLPHNAQSVEHEGGTSGQGATNASNAVMARGLPSPVVLRGTAPSPRKDRVRFRNPLHMGAEAIQREG